ncbi:MAG: hypothetical protein ABI674_01925 [Spartobacteria bacterium]
MRVRFLCIAIFLGGIATLPAAERAGLSALTGSELVAKLNQPDTCAAAFAELYRRSEPANDRRHLSDYLNPEVVVCPQPNDSPIYLVLADQRYDSKSKDEYEMREVDRLFSGAGTSPSAPPPVEKWRKDRVIFGFSANGEKLMPFGGWNMVHGYLFDLNRDGFIERAEKQAYSPEKGGDTIEFLQVERVARKAVPLLTVALNRGEKRDWGWAMQKEADGSYAFAVGPKGGGTSGPEGNESGFKLNSIAAVFRWNAEHDRYEGPAGSAAEHFILVEPGADIFERVIAIDSGPPFAAVAAPKGPAAPSPAHPAAPLEKWHYVSLREKSDDELVAIMTAGKDANEAERDEIVPTHLPPRFWELPPKEAALALVEANRSPENRAACQVALDDGDGVAPPASGEIGFEWKDSRCMAIDPGAGRTTLVYQPGRSRFTLAQVIIDSGVSPGLLARSLSRPRTADVPDDLARHVYETIWWLGRVRALCAGGGGKMFSTADGELKFWLNPKAQPALDTILLSGALSERWSHAYTREMHANFAYLVLREFEISKLHLLDPEAERPRIGTAQRFTPDEDFVYNRKPPAPGNPKADKAEVSRLLGLLKPRGGVGNLSVIGRLVPDDDPLRFRDPRIDERLFQLGQTGLSAKGSGDFVRYSDATWAVHALAQRGRDDVFDLTMALLRKESSSSAARALGGASLLVAQYPKFRERVRFFLEEALRDIARPRLETRALFDGIWVGSFTELLSILEDLATASPNEIASRRSSSSGMPADGGRFHEARRILTAWREEDPLTRIKLFALLEANTYREERLPSVVRPLYDQLSPARRQVYRDFLASLKTREEQERPVFISKVERIEALQRECEAADRGPR